MKPIADPARARNIGFCSDRLNPANSPVFFYLEVRGNVVLPGSDGFVAKNADAFQITGYDCDAVPKYLGVWEWADLEMEECCPFCGCLGGMHFQDASQMYYCISCDTLTDLSELDTPDEEPEE